jgi:hypothetical protein
VLGVANKQHQANQFEGLLDEFGAMAGALLISNT